MNLSNLATALEGGLENNGLLKYTKYDNTPGLDFNSYTTPGFYSLINPTSHSNKPAGMGANDTIGLIIVGGWNGQRLVQFLVTMSGQWRRYIDYEGWHSWT
jgi:hypothetical protein